MAKITALAWITSDWSTRSTPASASWHPLQGHERCFSIACFGTFRTEKTRLPDELANLPLAGPARAWAESVLNGRSWRN